MITWVESNYFSSIRALETYEDFQFQFHDEISGSYIAVDQNSTVYVAGFMGIYALQHKQWQFIAYPSSEKIDNEDLKNALWDTDQRTIAIDGDSFYISSLGNDIIFKMNAQRELLWFVQPSHLIPSDNTNKIFYGVAIDHNRLVYAVSCTFSVIVLTPEGEFVRILAEIRSTPYDIAFDSTGNLHTVDGYGKLIISPDGVVTSFDSNDDAFYIAIDKNDDYRYCSELDSCVVGLYDPKNKLIANVNIPNYRYGYGIAVDPNDGSIWVGSNYELIHFPCLWRNPPPSLSYLSQLVIKRYENVLPVSLLPNKFTVMFPEWTQPIKIEVRPWQVCVIPLQLNLKTGMSLLVVKWMVCYKLNVKYDTVLEVKAITTNGNEVAANDGILTIDMSIIVVFFD